MRETTPHTNPPLLLFDGVCNLCNSIVQFVIRQDKRQQIRFAALQTTTGQSILQKNKLAADDLKTFMLVKGDRVYLRSTAALELFKILGGLWSLLYIFIIVPRPIRDAIYNFIANNRYRWFGKKESCMIPSPELKARFIED